MKYSQIFSLFIFLDRLLPVTVTVTRHVATRGIQQQCPPNFVVARKFLQPTQLWSVGKSTFLHDVYL